MKTRLGIILSAALIGVATSADVASAQTWASWSRPTDCAGSVTGSFGSATVTYAGNYNGVQDAGLQTCVAAGSPWGFSFGGQNFFTPTAPYAPTPTNASFIQLVDVMRCDPTPELCKQYVPISTHTITFSQAVIDPYIALISVGNPTTTVNWGFNGLPFRIVSYDAPGSSAGNTPFFGNSATSLTLNSDMTSLAAREFSGVLQLKGTYSSFTFTSDNNENWNGFTVGAASISTVPEPSTYALMATGLLAMGIVARRRRKS